MTIADYRDTYSWQAAVELGRPLTVLTEELPAQEDRGLIMALQSLMIELPAAIAGDLVAGTSTRLAVIFRLQAALELIERVYPALDTAASKNGLDAIVERTESADFAAIVVKPEPYVESEETPVATTEAVADSV